MSNEIFLMLLQPDFDVSTCVTKQHVGSYKRHSMMSVGKAVHCEFCQFGQGCGL